MCFGNEDKLDLMLVFGLVCSFWCSDVFFLISVFILNKIEVVHLGNFSIPSSIKRI